MEVIVSQECGGERDSERVRDWDAQLVEVRLVLGRMYSNVLTRSQLAANSSTQHGSPRFISG